MADFVKHQDYNIRNYVDTICTLPDRQKQDLINNLFGPDENLTFNTRIREKVEILHWVAHGLL